MFHCLATRHLGTVLSTRHSLHVMSSANCHTQKTVQHAPKTRQSNTRQCCMCLACLLAYAFHSSVFGVCLRLGVPKISVACVALSGPLSCDSATHTKDCAADAKTCQTRYLATVAHCFLGHAQDKGLVWHALASVALLTLESVAVSTMYCAMRHATRQHTQDSDTSVSLSVCHTPMRHWAMRHEATRHTHDCWKQRGTIQGSTNAKTRTMHCAIRQCVGQCGTQKDCAHGTVRGTAQRCTHAQKHTMHYAMRHWANALSHVQ